MKQTDELKGQIFRLMERSNFIPYIASVDITAHSNLLDGSSLHIAFARDLHNKLYVSLCHVGPVLRSYKHTRSFSEINTNKTENPHGHDVFPGEFVRFLTKLGLSRQDYQNLVQRAFDELTLI